MVIDGIDSRLLFCGLVGLVAAERLAELALARRNTRIALAHGGIESGRGHYPWMVALHTAFLFAAPLEVLALDRPFVPSLAAAMALVLALAMGLRGWVIATLSWRWTTRVITIPGLAPVTGGPFRFSRHPNYVAVMLEFVALPLVHTAWLTALVFGLLGGMLLRVRIRVENEALARAARS